MYVSKILSLFNGPFAASGHMVQNPPCWRASCLLGHPEQSDFIKTNLHFLCFGCPSALLALQHGGFCTMCPLAAKGPLNVKIKPIWDTTFSFVFLHSTFGVFCNPAIIDNTCFPGTTLLSLCYALKKLEYASSNSFASLVLSKLPACIHNSIYVR